jgi:hypothetical protein
VYNSFHLAIYPFLSTLQTVFELSTGSVGAHECLLGCWIEPFQRAGHWIGQYLHRFGGV